MAVGFLIFPLWPPGPGLRFSCPGFLRCIRCFELSCGLVLGSLLRLSEPAESLLTAVVNLFPPPWCFRIYLVWTSLHSLRSFSRCFFLYYCCLSLHASLCLRLSFQE